MAKFDIDDHNVVTKDGQPLVAGLEAKITNNLVTFYRGDQAVMLLDAVDATVILLNNEQQTITWAKEVGAKRFMQQAPSAGTESYAEGFSRDRQLMLDKVADEVAIDLDIHFPENTDDFAANYPGGAEAFYKKAQRLLQGAGFTEGKQQEYQSGGLEDVMARLRNDHQTMRYAFGVNSEGELTCMMRILICPGNNLIYLSDESPDEGKEQQFPRLFNAVKTFIKEKFANAHVFMRAASGKEAFYESLGCSGESVKGAHVLHGAPAPWLRVETDGVVAEDNFVRFLLQRQKLHLSQLRDQHTAKGLMSSQGGSAEEQQQPEEGKIPKPF